VAPLYLHGDSAVTARKSGYRIGLEVALKERSGLVLVVDDDDDIRESLEVLLRLHGYHVATAADGAEALARLQSDPTRPCLILLDLMMPGMNGFQMLKAMAGDASLKDIPVVVVTGAGVLVDKRRDEITGQVIRKPFELPELMSAVRKHCAQPVAARG
jgi:two-component system, chemotaxis family, chemotaxis protein CheY